jgi:hypothetical protein
MKTISEGDLVFHFPENWEASKYDDWAYYRKQFQKTADSKAVDILAFDPRARGTLWMIEIKDYRQHPRTKNISLWDEVTQKVRDTLAGLLAASIRACHDEIRFAKQCCRAQNVRVVLHLEQPVKTSKLFPRTFNPADLQLKLKSLIKAVDAHPKVVNRLNMLDTHRFGWRVKSS